MARSLRLGSPDRWSILSAGQRLEECMPTRRVAMRHVREILRLSLDCGLSTRVVGERVGVGSTTVRDTLRRFSRSGL
ncbi:helix-turn-helix domain-containing protein, partial [Parapedomonas caeni]